jgi:hypothetical protein
MTLPSSFSMLLSFTVNCVLTESLLNLIHNKNKYGSVIKGLMDQFCLDQDQYPKTINHATHVLSNHKFDEKFYENRNKNQDRKNKDEKKTKDDQEGSNPPKEINFAQLEGACYCCGKKGHHSPKCPEKNKDK